MNIDVLDLDRTLAQLCAQARQQPVIVEAEGQPQAVLMSYADFLRLGGRASPGATAQDFSEIYKDWFSEHNRLVEEVGVFGEAYRPW